MDKYAEELRDSRAKLEDIDEKISEKTAEIKKLTEEIEDIYDMKKQSDNDYEEILSYWTGTSAYLRMSESNDARNTLLRRLIVKREDDLRNTKEEKKRLLDIAEGLRLKQKCKRRRETDGKQ